MVVVAQPWEYIKTDRIVYLKEWILWYELYFNLKINCIIIYQLNKRETNNNLKTTIKKNKIKLPLKITSEISNT